MESLLNVKFTEFVSKRISSPTIDRQLLLKFIPLMVKKHDLENYFSKVGKIENIRMRTQEGFESAVITFDSPDALSSFVTLQWMVFIQGHAIKVTPANLILTHVLPVMNFKQSYQASSQISAHRTYNLS